ncbi:class I SAM-dependent methyltransferase [Methyloradius palustris]|uniref:Methyltransferase type 11 domain-containing protein n=1 Tax=Methyloradius palustris TaxID=2778876 RepID=A0A8D5GD60_9PROT|nr:class I SAM-dependent methyltransferase [Methyloradius palustris]BCM25278.1 hypothetical protein ZMTM_15370 [Methyloradius palustris]
MKKTIKNSNEYEKYFSHLKQISILGSIYKKYLSSPIIFISARFFGKDVIEIGSGIGSGLLGSFPNTVKGLDINPIAIDYCKSKGMRAELINIDGKFPISDSQFDCCVLDNVLEHIEDPQKTLDECYRITRQGGGLVIVVPGIRGFNSDIDHKKFYDSIDLKGLDVRWQFLNSFSIPFFFKSDVFSRLIRQYCLIAVYRKI